MLCSIQCSPLLYNFILFCSTDLITLLTKVNNDVSEENIPAGEGGEIKKQVPMPQYTLRKQLYFFPDNLPKIYSQCSEASLDST